MGACATSCSARVHAHPRAPVAIQQTGDLSTHPKTLPQLRWWTMLDRAGGFEAHGTGRAGLVLTALSNKAAGKSLMHVVDNVVIRFPTPFGIALVPVGAVHMPRSVAISTAPHCTFSRRHLLFGFSLNRPSKYNIVSYEVGKITQRQRKSRV